MSSDASEEMVRFTAELQQTVDELGDALTRRADRLKELIAEADRRIESLATASAPDVWPASAGVPARPSAHAASMTEPEVVESAPATPPAAPQPYETAVALPRSEGRASAEEVRRLAAQGLDADTIARLTNRGREEVRLLIARSGAR